MEGCKLLENFLWTRVDGQLHMVAESVDTHIRCHDTGDTSTSCRIRLCAFGQDGSGLQSDLGGAMYRADSTSRNKSKVIRNKKEKRSEVSVCI